MAYDCEFVLCKTEIVLPERRQTLTTSVSVQSKAISE